MTLHTRHNHPRHVFHLFPHGSVSYCAQSAILAQVLEGGTIGPTRPFGCYSILGKSEMGGMAGNEECKRCQRRKEVRCATFCIATFALAGHGRTTTRLAQRISRRLFLSRGCSVPFPSHALRFPPPVARGHSCTPRGPSVVERKRAPHFVQRCRPFDARSH